MNVFQIVVEPLVFNILDGLPFQFVNFRSWDFHDKAASNVEVGDAWALITPRETCLHVCNPEAINEGFTLRQDFIRP